MPRTILPTTAELFTRALADSDFLGELAPQADMMRLSADAVDVAIDQWEAANDVPGGTVAVPPLVINTVRGMLIAHGTMVLDDAAEIANDTLRDAVESGDVDSGGNAVGYPRYRGMV